MKIEISICTGLMLNSHSNPYIESTTVLSDLQCYHKHSNHLPMAIMRLGKEFYQDLAHAY